MNLNPPPQVAVTSSPPAPGTPSQVGSLHLSQQMLVDDDFLVDGDLHLSGNALLEVDYRASADQVFEVRGNITLRDQAVLRILGSSGGDQFIVANQFSKQHSLTTFDNTLIELRDLEFKTQTGTSAENGSVDMSYFAYGTSRGVFERVHLDTATSWLLGNFHEQSELRATDVGEVPTEVYLNEACTVTLSGRETATGYWLTFARGSNVLNLPDVTQPYHWEVSPATGHDVDWTLKVEDARVGPAVILAPGAELTVNGRGTPESGELTIGYVPGPGPETLDDLQVGLQNRVLGQRLTLNNVQLGPVAWQIYVGSTEPVLIKNSTINELGVLSGAQVTVENCVTQLAVLECSAPDGVLTVRDSDIWNQKIVAGANGVIELVGCNIFGSEFLTRSQESQINITGSVFFENPPSQAHLGVAPIDLLTGYPNYDPFAPEGPSRASGPGSITVTDSTNSPF